MMLKYNKSIIPMENQPYSPVDTDQFSELTEISIENTEPAAVTPDDSSVDLRTDDSSVDLHYRDNEPTSTEHATEDTAPICEHYDELADNIGDDDLCGVHLSEFIRSLDAVEDTPVATSAPSAAELYLKHLNTGTSNTSYDAIDEFNSAVSNAPRSSGSGYVGSAYPDYDGRGYQPGRTSYNVTHRDPYSAMYHDRYRYTEKPRIVSFSSDSDASDELDVNPVTLSKISNDIRDVHNYARSTDQQLCDMHVKIKDCNEVIEDLLESLQVQNARLGRIEASINEIKTAMEYIINQHARSSDGTIYYGDNYDHSQTLPSHCKSKR